MTATLDDVLTPLLLVDTGRLDDNIAAMARRYADAGVRLRPHVKTSKCEQVMRRQLAAGAVGFTCSTAAEIAWLRGLGVADLLWAQQPVGRAKVAFVVDTIRRGGPFLVALDSEAAAAPLSAAADAAGIVVPYLVEVDTGHGRAGVRPDDAADLARRLAALPGLDLRGVLTHEGQLSRHPGDRAAVEGAGQAAGALIVATATAIREAGFAAPIVSVGSTPGATSAPLVPGVTEARPGTYVYFDANQLRLGSATLDECALTVLSRVISAHGDGTVIIDAGIKAMSSDAIAAAGSVGLVCDTAGRPLPDVVFTDGNEEHGFLSCRGPDRLEVGDLVRIVPNHACGTVNMYGSLRTVRDGVLGESWPISARH